MKLRNILISLFLIISTGIVSGQYRVVNIDDIPATVRPYLMPDVMGKVLISDHMQWVDFRGVSDTLTLYPNWPKLRDGYNERGGTYCNMDQDAELEIVYPIGSKLYAINFDGTAVGGWPVTLDLIPDGAASFGDIDGDGFGEIVVTTHDLGSFSQGYVYAFEINGTNVYGFPVETEGGPVRTPVLADLDQDGADEIIIAVRNWPDGFVHIYSGDGTPFGDWPQRMNSVPATTVAVGDIDGDLVPEIIGQSYTSVHAWFTSGTIVPGFPFTPGNNRVFSHSSPVLADLDGDGFREILIGDHNSAIGDGQVHILKNDGTYFPGWPKTTDFWIYSPPSVGDVNGDGNLDVVIADYFHEITNPSNKLYAWDAQSGEILQGFPVDSLYGVFNQVLLADFDSDNEVELVIDANIGPEGRYCGFNHDGTVMEGWPLGVSGSSFSINPFLADLNGDGIYDFSGGGYEPGTNKTYLYLWNTHAYVNEDLDFLTILQFNTRHNGVYGDNLMVGVAEKTLEASPLLVFPNPSSHYIEVSLPGPGQYLSRLVNTSGICMLEQSLTSSGDGSVNLNISPYPPGYYVLEMVKSTGERYQTTVVIRR